MSVIRHWWYRSPSGRSPGRNRVGAGLVWLAFIVVPVVNAVGTRAPEPRYALVIAGAVAFSLSYIWLVLVLFDERRRVSAKLLSAILLALTVVLTLGDRPSWGFLFSYCAACAALTAPSPYGFTAVIGCTVLSFACTLVAGASTGSAAGYAASTVGVGLLLTLMRDLRASNHELTAARAELAQTAVTAERERFARDLHDLLGHSLSVIAIKAELAGRLLPGDPDRAAVEVGDVEGVARTALSEVREAVSGYRRPTLDGELEGARVALAAAGIIAVFQRSPVDLPAEVEAVLAWAVREGATNVIRHSGAHRCEVRVHAGSDGAGVEVVDDGAGCAGARGGSDRGGVGPVVGHGLVGLRERAAVVRGRLEAGAADGGGFRLAVSVPVPGAVPGGRVGARGRVGVPGPRLSAEPRRDPGADGRGPGAWSAARWPRCWAWSLTSRSSPRWRAATRCSNAAPAVSPDVALLDIEMPGATGLDAAEQLAQRLPACRILILTTFGRPGYLRRAMEGGAAGFVLKDAPAPELAAAIRRALAGERIVDPGLAAAALSQGECPADPARARGPVGVP